MPGTLGDFQVFADLDRQELSALELISEPRTYADGEILAAEGALVADVLLISDGVVHASAKQKDQELQFSTLSSGDVILEEASFAATPASHTATYRAATTVKVVRVPVAQFIAIVSNNAAARGRLEQVARDAAEAKFLRLASPFSGLAPLQVRKLAERIEAVTLTPGAVILREGDRGDRAFLITRGVVDVVMSLGGAGERVIATLREGMMFGEASLLTGEVRNASARAKSEVTLLQFTRDDLAEAMKTDRTAAKRVFEFLALRARPCRASGIEETTATSWSGEEFAVLKNRKTGMSYKLSREGAFLWKRLDGKHTLRDLTLDYLGEFKQFAPMQIAELLGGLAAAGFLTAPASPDLDLVLTPAQRAALKARELLTKQISISGIDGVVSKLHSAFGWLLHPSVHIIYGAVSMVGVIAFITHFGELTASISAAGWLGGVVAFVLAYVPSIIVHEAAHALVAKKYGAEVPRIGYGWNWIAPVAFVDTTDMWRAPRGPRVRTSLAGPYANLILAGAFGLLALATSNPLLDLYSSAAAILGYAMAVFNMLPLLGFDGHHVLRDLRSEKA